MQNPIHIHPDIRQAETMPASFYTDPAYFALSKEKIFAKSWQWIGSSTDLGRQQNVHPFLFLEHFLNEPMLLSRDKDNQWHCLSNVCTHRANLVVTHNDQAAKLVCPYHGRRFALDGQFEFMPEFREAQDFPRDCEHLHRFPLVQWGPFLFSGIQPTFPLEDVLEKMKKRIGFLPLEKFRFDASHSKDYLVHAHWALYCDNYLEGFHIPFVHKELNDALDYGHYTTLIDTYFNLQIGYAKDDSDVFDLPQGHPDYGQQVAAYYYWLFPNMMFNFYPWGISINIVKPITEQRTRVSFLSYVYDESKMEQGAGALLDKVEREDEFVVESVQRGMRSRVYKRGRYSPQREQGVHHFHRLLSQFL